MSLLAGFGVVDAYLFLWLGDRLFFYGVAGLILYFPSQLSPQLITSQAGRLRTALALRFDSVP